MRDGCLMVLKCNAVSAEFKSGTESLIPFPPPSPPPSPLLLPSFPPPSPLLLPPFPPPSPLLLPSFLSLLSFYSISSSLPLSRKASDIVNLEIFVIENVVCFIKALLHCTLNAHQWGLLSSTLMHINGNYSHPH